MRCNMNCTFCGHKRLPIKFTHNAVPDMTLDCFKYILSSNHPDCTITLSGGEPFLNKSIIDYLFTLERQFAIHTNGSILLADHQRPNAIQTLRISINDYHKFPSLYNQLKSTHANRIRVNTFLNSPNNTFEICRKAALDGVYNISIRIDYLAEWNDTVLIDKIDELAARLSYEPIILPKLKVYRAYHESQMRQETVKKYGTEGQPIGGIYVADVPRHEYKEEDLIWNTIVYEVYQTGKQRYSKGQLGYSTPSAYYHCYFFEKLKEEIEKRKEHKRVIFNSFFANR